jgi:Bacterial signalling protein N terminal repeat
MRSYSVYIFQHLFSHRARQKMMRLGWLFLTGVCTASGIWATHFIAMLAYEAGRAETESLQQRLWSACVWRSLGQRWRRATRLSSVWLRPSGFGDLGRPARVPA